MLRSHAGLSDRPKPGCSGTNTSNCFDSRSNTGSHTGKPLAPCRNKQRRAGAAAQHPDIDVADLVFRFRPRHGMFSVRPNGESHRSRRLFRNAGKRQEPPPTPRPISPSPFRRASGAAWRMRGARPADRSDRRGRLLDGNPKATWFKSAGPERPSLSATSWARGSGSRWRSIPTKRGFLPAFSERLTSRTTGQGSPPRRLSAGGVEGR